MGKTSILLMLREVIETCKNVDKIRTTEDCASQTFTQLGEKIDALRKYRDSVDTQTERDLIDDTLLTLFLTRQRNVEKARVWLNEAEEQFELERAKRGLNNCLPLVKKLDN